MFTNIKAIRLAHDKYIYANNELMLPEAFVQEYKIFALLLL